MKRGLFLLLYFTFSPSVFAEELSPTFTKDILPLLLKHCVACHMTGTEPGQLALSPKAAYESLVGKPSVESVLLRVAPGDPDKSYVMHKIDGIQITVNGSGERMPLGAPPLNGNVSAQIRSWIAAGAKND